MLKKAIRLPFTSLEKSYSRVSIFRLINSSFKPSTTCATVFILLLLSLGFIG
nr:MAG TPA: hypothetical protein [Caudoviricetes sp.]